MPSLCLSFLLLKKHLLAVGLGAPLGTKATPVACETGGALTDHLRNLEYKTEKHTPILFKLF